MPDSLTVTAQAVLDATVTILDTTTALAPESQFLTPSRPAIDCEFVAVQVSRLMEDRTSPLGITETKKRNKFGNIIIATLIIWVVRCGPDISAGVPPSDADKTANATTVQTDGWVLWNGIRAIQDTLFDACLGVYFDGGTPVQESGGFVGWQFQLGVSVEGYVP